jgi:hypothetical protein
MVSALVAFLTDRPLREDGTAAAPAPQKQLGRSLESAGPPVGRIWRK